MTVAEFITFWREGLPLILTNMVLFGSGLFSLVLGWIYDKGPGEKKYNMKKKYFSTVSTYGVFTVWLILTVWMMTEGYM